MVLLPEEIEKATHRASMMAISYEAERASRKEICEGAIKRANRRANEAESNFRNRSQTNTAKFKARDEAHAKEMDALRKEHQTEIEHLKASTLLRLEAKLQDAQVTAQETHLKIYDQLCSHIHQEVTQLQELQKRTGDNLETVKADSQALGAAIERLNDDLDDVGMKTIKKYAEAIRDDYMAVEAKLRGTFEVCGETREAVETLFKKVFGAEKFRIWCCLLKLWWLQGTSESFVECQGIWLWEVEASIW